MSPPRRNNRRLLRIFGILFVLACSLCLGVTFQWEANNEADLAGYKLHWGLTPGEPTQHRTLSTLTTTSVDDSEFQFDVPIYFTVTAFNLTGLESGPSNEVMWVRQLQVVPSPSPSPSPSPPSAPQNLRFKLTITYTREFNAGTIVNVIAPQSGFLRWSGDIYILGNFISHDTTAVIPNTDVRIEAIYE